MLKGSLAFALCTVLVASTAMAEKVPMGDDGGVFNPSAGAACETDAYKSYDGAGGAIPDNDPAGISFTGATVTDDGSTFTDVIVAIDMDHTWVGDLNISVGYDTDCDGMSETTVQLVCRPGQTDCDPAGTGFGCSDDLDGVYSFSDDASPALGVACAGGAQAPGCYGVSGDAGGAGALSDFDGMAKGGCFVLTAQDNAGGDTGSIRSWTVYTENSGGTPTETVNWSSVKSRF